jgi:anaerobic selenocysteine-containing dehydrogenase
MRKRQETLRDFTSVRRTTCCNCPTGCGMKVFLKDNAVVDIFGDEEHPVNKGSLCPKGLLAYRHLTNPERIVYPQIRERLDQPFRRATWEEAVSFASGRLKEITADYGKDSLFVYGDESVPFEYLAVGDLFSRRFGTQNGPYRFLPYPFGHEGRIKRMFGVPASRLLMNSLRDWCNSKCIVLYRSDLAASDPITFGHILDACDRGTTLLVIDAKRTVTSSKATLSLRVNPGSEPTVLKGILHLLMQKGQFDEKFIEEAVSDNSSLISGLEDFTPEKVAQCSGVKKTDLEKMTDLVGRSKPVQVITADWNTRRSLSEEELFLCGALVCLRGSVGIPGGGLNLMDVSPFPAEDVPHGEGDALLTGQGSLGPLSLEHILLEPSEIRSLIWQGNPSARLAQGKETKKALEKLPLIVHLSSYPNETFHYSHVSFPMSSWLEYAGLVTNNNGRAIQWHHRVVEPPGECRSPLEFWNELAYACGVSGAVPFHRRESDAADAADTLLRENPLTRSISVEKIDPEKNPPGGLLWPCVTENDLEFEKSRFVKGDIRGRNILFQRGQAYPLSDKRFPTPTGKITFFSLTSWNGKDTGSRNAEEKDACFLPFHDDLYPMMLITGLLVDFVEEYGYFVSDRDRGTVRLTVKVHPQTGKLLGVKNGEDIVVENSHGSITAPVWLSEDVNQGVIWAPEGLDPYQPHFHGDSPRSLFDSPCPYSGARSFTRVTAYRPGQDKREVTRKLLAFLEGPGSMVRQ